MIPKKDSAIVCCRAVSMFMIVLCHIVGYYTFLPGHTVLGDILDVGVYTFLAISGYLYGGKNIQNFKTWFRKRCIAVVLPALLITVFVMTADFLAGKENSWFSIMIYLLNLQGIGFLNPGFYRYFSEIQVLGPLWFVTVIMLCYCMVPLLQHYRERIICCKHGILFVVVLAIISYVLATFQVINLFYFLTFFIGYILAAKKSLQPIRGRCFAAGTVLMFAAQICRLLLRSVCDGTPVYQNYTLLSHMILGIWIFGLFLFMRQVFPDLINRVAENRITAAANDISLYVYLTHSCFCRGSLNMYQLFDNLFVATLTFAVTTLVASVMLQKITAAVTSVWTRRT